MAGKDRTQHATRAAYYLVDSGNGVMTSFGFFDKSGESSEIAAAWLREEKLERALPNPPRTTAGEVVAQMTNGVLVA